MLTLEKQAPSVAEKIIAVKKSAFQNGIVSNELQAHLEKIYGKTTPEILRASSGYSKEWGKFIDID